MNEQTIFTAALERPPGDRAAFLDQVCGSDKQLRERVEKLLRLHDDAGSFLECPAANPRLDIAHPVRERPGRTLGPYKLLQEIGEGGCGVVYMAEQQQPVRRKVALKIIKPGMDTRQVIARFEAEQQALAMMDHPNIARVLDAGTTEIEEAQDSGVKGQWKDERARRKAESGNARATANHPKSEIRNPKLTGRPYFAMELVHGVPITEYCDQQKLSTGERLKLFIDVCRAVQHAHQKGIIHRDLKPSNIMVTMDGERPLVKVIDFGVAKALDQQLTEKTLFTAYGQMVGTPMYMSPEQAQLSAVDVDTRSDVYALGVLL